MKKCFRQLFFCSLSLCILFWASPTLAGIDTSWITDKVKTVDIPFIANKGQIADDVSYYASTLGGTLFVTHSGELVYKLPKIEISDSESNIDKKNLHYSGGVVLRESLVNARISTITASRKSETKVNYFKGNDSSKWLTGITTYGELSLGEIYKGIELRLMAHGDNVEKLFYVSPEADPALIKLAITGANGLKVLDTGELLASTPLGDVRFTRPIAWQEKDGKRVQVIASYEIISDAGNLVYGFKVGLYDQTSALIIDPLLASTYIGGGSIDSGSSITLDSVGNVYVVGHSFSTDYPTTSGAYDQTHNGGNYDITISKFSSDLSTLLASTYLGGGGFDSGSSMALDSIDNVYVRGSSGSTDYPTTSEAYDQTLDGYSDTVISKLSPDLSTLLASTYLGGGDSDSGSSIALDSIDNVYVSGGTTSSDYPTTSGAYDQTLDGYSDTVISKLSPDLSTLLVSTYLGGGGSDGGDSIALDSLDNVYVSGDSVSMDYPTTSNAYDQTHNGYRDTFISKLSSDLSTLLASTYLGGGKTDYGGAIILDSIGNVYMTGNGYSTDYPTTSNAYDQTHNGYRDIFISKLSSDLSTLLASTYLGGEGSDSGGAVILDTINNVYVIGGSDSTDYPTTRGVYDQTYNGGDKDIVISKLSSDLSALLASTYLGGGGSEYGGGIILDSIGNVYMTGNSDSTDYPTTSEAYDQTLDGYSDRVISKFSADLNATINSFSWAMFMPAIIGHGATSYYDTFNVSNIDLSKWQDSVGEIKDGKLWLEKQGAGAWSSTSLTMVEENITNDFSSKVSIDSSSYTLGDSSVAVKVGGIYYNDTYDESSSYNNWEGNIYADIRLQLYAGNLRARAVVVRYDNSDGSLRSSTSATFTQTIDFNTEYTLSIKLLGSSFIFSCNEETITYQISTSIYPSNKLDRSLSAMVYADAGESGYIKGSFDDVCIKESCLP